MRMLVGGLHFQILHRQRIRSGFVQMVKIRATIQGDVRTAEAIPRVGWIIIYVEKEIITVGCVQLKFVYLPSGE